MATHALAGTAAAHWYDGLTRKHWATLNGSFLGWIFDGYEAMALIVVLGPMLHSLLTPAEAKSFSVYAGIVVGITLLGWAFGGVIGGVLADYVGRKRMMMWSIFLYAIFSGLTAASTGFVMLCVMRFLTGLALGSEWSTGVALVSETWPENARTKGLGFLQSGFGWGSLVASLVWFALSSTHPFGDESWRLVFLVGALPAFVVLYIRRGLDESEKWQRAVREKRWAATPSDAQATAKKAGADNKRPFTLKQLFTEPTALRCILIFIVLGIVTNVGFWAIATWLPGTTARLAKAAGAADPGQWAAAEAVLYTLGSIVAYVLAGFIIDVIGRRWFVCLAFVGSLIITYITYRLITTAVGMEIAAPINGFFTLGCAYVWITIYPGEVFTSTVRTSALSAIFSGSRFVAWFFPIIAGGLIAFFGGTSNLAVTVGSVFVLGIILPWFLPETKGKGMPA